jgi:hypothetical protein
VEHLFSGPNMAPSLIAIGVAAVILVLRNSRPRQLKIERLWLWPMIYVVLLGFSLADTTFDVTAFNIGLQVAAFAIGGVIGWQRARFMEIRIHPQTHELSSRASPIGVLFIFAILVLRLALRGWVAQNATGWHVPLVDIGTAFLVLAVGMLVAQRLEIWRRATRMLAEARAAGGGPPPPESLVS